MNDKMNPHTAWFTQSKTAKVTKEYCYETHDGDFVSWHVRENRNDIIEEWSNLIYAKRSFGKYVSITEKRSLVYPLKSFVRRDKNGATAGMYSFLEGKTITVFYDENCDRKQTKISMDQIGSKATDVALHGLAKVVHGDFRIDETVANLHALLIAFKEVVNDNTFIAQLCEINDWIETDDDSESDSESDLSSDLD